MAENKKSFVLYCDLIHTIKKMPPEKAGELFLHILKYVNDENPSTEDLIIELTFEPIKQSLKRDLKKYEGKKLQWSDAGKASAEKRKALKDLNEHTTESTNVKTVATESTVSVNDSVNVNVSDNVNVIKKNIIERKADFKKSFLPFLEIYESKLLNDFFQYWTEHGEKDKKMRFEKEKSFGISRRLSTWKEKEKKFGNNVEQHLTAVEKMNKALRL